MNKDNEDFLNELLNDFKLESAEHLQLIVNGLLDLEKDLKNPPNMSLVESVFRATHSMKGSARAVNLMQIERLCMGLEGVFHEIKKGKLSLSAPMFDVFFQATDLLALMLKELDEKQKTVSENNISQIGTKLKQILEKGIAPVQFETKKQEIAPKPHESGVDVKILKNSPLPQEPLDTPTSGQNDPADPSLKEKHPERETIRVASAKLIDMLRMAEEMIAMKSALQFNSQQLQQISTQIGQWGNSYEERILHENRMHKQHNQETSLKQLELFKTYEKKLLHLNGNTAHLQRTIARAIDDLILSMKKTLMQPFSTLFMVVPRIVRDLSKEYNKEIKLELEGAEIEIDRRILEEMKDPIIHLIRNCIDHGIETREERLKKKKPETGRLTIKVYSDTDQKIKMVISDDGAGIDQKKLVAAAIKSGTIKAEEVETISANEINMLIFGSGISTSPFITDVSGRGIGMAIVAEKVAGLGGNISIETTAQVGTTFIIKLPQTLATFKGILVKAGEAHFLIPTTSVVKALKIVKEDIQSVESKSTIRLDSENIGLVSLADVLGINRPYSTKKGLSMQGLVIQHATKKLIFVVEEVLGEHEGIVKPLGSQLKHINNIAGASLLGNGKIVPVLQIAELLATASGKRFTAQMEEEPTTDKQTDEKQIKVLVAEDSITIRNMLRNYLESANFDVNVAVDGQEAYELLQTEQFDIVVSDVEMPRMNGFELTLKIRQDLSMRDIPVILVTALESQDDRRKGMDAGANAYIVKSSFEKSNLIDTIHRLI